MTDPATMTHSGRLGIIAGGGAAPRLLIDRCRQDKRDFFVLCLEGNADRELTARNDFPHIWLPLGAGARFKDIFFEQSIKELVMIGRVRRPSFSEIKPDWWTVKVIAQIGLHSLGDDGLLKAVSTVLEDECHVKVIGVQEIMKELLTPVGNLTHIEPDADALNDIERGVTVLRAMGSCDVGQAVVVQQGLVLGVEAIEGTDELISRCAKLARHGKGGVLVKMAKPSQDQRLDLPAIGPDTILHAHKAGLRGIALEAGRSLCLSREDLVRMAREYQLFVIGITPKK